MPSVRTHFPRLTGIDAKESSTVASIIDLTEESNESVNVAGLIEAPDWRYDRADKDESPLVLNQLNEPVPDHQRCLWKWEVVKDHPNKPTSDNLEDMHYHYANLGDGTLSRVSSTTDVEACYKERKKEFRTSSMLLHLDKNMNKSDSEKESIAEQYSLCRIKLDKATKALNVFNK